MYRTTRHRALPGRRGRTPVDLGSGASEAPGFFLAYWRRTESGTWRIAAFLVGPDVTLDRVRVYTAAVRSRRSHEHLVAILRERSDTPVEELERLRAPAMPRRFADLELDPATRDVRRAGRPVTLRPKEYDLLRALVARAGAVASRRELLAEVWDIRRT